MVSMLPYDFVVTQSCVHILLGRFDVTTWQCSTLLICDPLVNRDTYSSGFDSQSRCSPSFLVASPLLVSLCSLSFALPLRCNTLFSSLFFSLSPISPLRCNTRIAITGCWSHDLQRSHFSWTNDGENRKDRVVR